MNLIKTNLNGLVFWYREDDKFVGQRIALGKYEEYETMLMKYETLRLAKLTQGTAVAVDVGANIGYYTLLLAQKCKKVYAIEPDKESFKILRKNIEENKLKNVVLMNLAVGSKKEKKYLIKDSENLGNSKISDKNGQLINVLRLDDILINEHKFDLIKIDTQGWESEVIDGAKNIIERDKPIMFLEYTPGEYKDNKMIKYLQKIYKNIWSIDYWFYICRKGIHVDKKTGYVDLFLKTNVSTSDFWWMIKEVRIKKIIRYILNGLK